MSLDSCHHREAKPWPEIAYLMADIPGQRPEMYRKLVDQADALIVQAASSWNVPTIPPPHEKLSWSRFIRETCTRIPVLSLINSPYPQPPHGGIMLDLDKGMRDQGYLALLETAYAGISGQVVQDLRLLFAEYPDDPRAIVEAMREKYRSTGTWAAFPEVVWNWRQT